MQDKKHYFDWAATAPIDEEIAQKALAYSIEHWGNPSSLHQAGNDAKTALEESRNRCAQILNVKKENVFFTSGGTESDHIPLLANLMRPQKGSIVISAIEHPALREMAKAMEHLGIEVIFVKPDKNGFVCEDLIAQAVKENTTFVSVMAVNNETGAIQPIYKIADKLTEISKGHRRPFFHVDAVQACGKIPLNLSYKGIDSASMSAHKISGPRGIGILYLAKEINAFLRGGGQEKNIRSGTENIFGAHAFALCLEKYFIRQENKTLWERFEAQKIYIKNFINSILEIPECTIIPHVREDPCLSEEKFSPWIVQAAFKNIPGQVMVRALNAKGFAISTGSACSAGKNSRPILEAMNVNADEKESAVRFSFGSSTSESAMMELVQAVKEVNKDFN